MLPLLLSWGAIVAAANTSLEVMVWPGLLTCFTAEAAGINSNIPLYETKGMCNSRMEGWGFPTVIVFDLLHLLIYLFLVFKARVYIYILQCLLRNSPKMYKICANERNWFPLSIKVWYTEMWSSSKIYVCIIWNTSGRIWWLATLICSYRWVVMFPLLLSDPVPTNRPGKV